MPKARKVPNRTCVGCGRIAAKRELVRVVRTPDSQVVLDITGRRAGRGAYVCPSSECLAKAVKGDRLQRTLEVGIPEETLQALSNQIKATESRS